MNFLCNILFFLLIFSSDLCGSSSFSVTAEQQEIVKNYNAEILEDHPLPSEKEKLKLQIDAAQAWKDKVWYQIIYNFEKVIRADPKDFVAWICLSQAYRSDKYNQTHKTLRKAFASALNAYKVAETEEDKLIALHHLALLKNEFKEIYEKALGQKNIEEIEKKFNLKILQYPHTFQIYEQNIPATSDVGIICLSWTKSLSQEKKYSFENFISLTPFVKDLAIVARRNQLCLKGLQFGTGYHLVLKKDLPGEKDYKSASDISLDFFIPHRKPALKFREYGYILPAHSAQIIPINSLNVSQVDLKIVRLPINNFSESIYSQDFLSSSIGAYVTDKISKFQGEEIGIGKLDLKTDIDQLVTHGLKMEQIIQKKLKTGIYVLQASLPLKPHDLNTFQWLIVTDIGLSTYKGADGIHIYARSLETAKSLENIEITLIAKNGQELGRARTDNQGYVKFGESLLQGKKGNALLIITAQNKNEDFTFLRIDTPPFNFEDRGVKGRSVEAGMEASVFTEKGIYHPGEVVHMTALVRDPEGKALSNLPFVFKIKRPDGVETLSPVLQDQGSGSYLFQLLTQSSNMTGLWKVEAYLDPKGEKIGSTNFKLEEFIPPRINLSLDFQEKIINPLKDFIIDVMAHYYYGPVASNLKVESIIDLIEASKPFEKYPHYYFGLEENPWLPYRLPALESMTNDEGKISFKSRFEEISNTTKILEARTTTTIFEAGGRGRTQTQKTLFWHQPYVIGIKPLFQGRNLSGNTVAAFNIVALNQKEELQKTSKLTCNLYEENQNFIYFRAGNEWNYEAAPDDRLVTSSVLETSSQEPVTLKIPMKWGRFRLEIIDEKTGVATSYRFTAGWQTNSNLPERPDLMEIALDKESYKEGDKAYLNVVSPYEEGELVIVALGHKHQSLYHGPVSSKGNRIEILLDKTVVQKGGMYLMATVFKPGNLKAKRMPGRAVGLIWLPIENQETKIDLNLYAPDFIEPEQNLEVKACVFKPLKDLYLQITVVDESVLNLTNFLTPDPFHYFFGQTHLQYQSRDSYGFLINPYGTRPVDFKTGGDSIWNDLAVKPLGARPYKTLQIVSPILNDFKEEKAGYCATTSFKVPEFSGNGRITGIAWTPKAVGSQSIQLTIRESLDSYIALPPFLAPQDEIQTILEIQNQTGYEEHLLVKVATEGSVTLNESFEQEISLQHKEQKKIPITFRADSTGIGKINLKIFKNQKQISHKNWDIAVRSPSIEHHQYVWGNIEAGKDLQLSQEIFKDYDPQTVSLGLTLGSLPDFGLKALSQQLKNYPYTCLEQLSSRLAAYLAVSDSSEQETISQLIDQISALQNLEGSFGLWEAYSQPCPWLSVYTLDLLYETFHRQWKVNRAVLEKGLLWMQNYLEYNQGPETISVKAYINYILAREGHLSLGILRYFADNHQNQFLQADDFMFMAAAFAHLKDAESAQIWLNRAFDFKEPEEKKNGSSQEFYFKSEVSQLALRLKLLTESFENIPLLQNIAMMLLDKIDNPYVLSTFEKGWLVRAGSRLSELQKPFHLEAQKALLDTTLKTWNQVFSYDDLNSPYILTNKNKTSILYSYSIKGELKVHKAFDNKGFDLKRVLYTMMGEPVNPENLKSGDLVVITLEGILKEPGVHEILLLDLLPAGFEIERIKIDAQTMTTQFPWLGELTSLERVEKREDRFVAAFRLQEDKDKKFKVAYIVRAVIPGQYIYPEASVESMYRPQFTARASKVKLKIIP